MKGLLCTAFALSLLAGTAAMAASQGHGTMGHGNMGQGNMGQPYSGQNSMGMDFSHFDQHHQYDRVHWTRGDHFSGHSIAVDDWRGHHLRKPPRGYHWVQNDDGDFILVAITSSIILDLMLNSMHH